MTAELVDDIAAIWRMNESFQPDKRHIINAAWNRKPERIPLYEHGIDPRIMEQVLGEPVVSILRSGSDQSHYEQYYRQFIRFYRFMGYDFANMDQNIGGYMPGSGALLNEKNGAVTDRASFRAYPWDRVPSIFKEKTYPHYEIFLKCIPDGMTAVGGAGNGIFECVQDIVGFTALCYMKSDDPDLYADVFKKQAEINYRIWEDLLRNFSGEYGVLRFGDDLGYKTNTMLSHDDILEYILPGYKPIVDLIHSYGKPFLFHSCGCIFGVMDDIIEQAGINAKHSNEDAIAPISRWIELYNDRIAIFGGLDVDVVCQSADEVFRAHVAEAYAIGKSANGFAFGSGNSIAHYVPYERYIKMIRIFRELRGEK